MIGQLLRIYYAIGERNKVFTRQEKILISTARTHTYTRLHNNRGPNVIGPFLRLYYAIGDRNTIFRRQLNILKIRTSK